MISDEVVSYARTALAQGATKDAVQQELQKSGWTSEQIAQIFEKVSVTVDASARLESTPPGQSTISPSPMEPNTTPSTTTGGAPKKNSRTGIFIVVVLLLIIAVGGGVYVYTMLKVVDEDQTTDVQQSSNQNASAPVATDLVDQRNAFDAAIDKPVLSDGQRLGSMLYQFSTVVPKGWGIVATSSDGYIHFDVVKADTGAAGGVIRVSRYLTAYPETVTLKEIAEKERQDLKARAEGFTEKSFEKKTIAGREIYVISAVSTFNGTNVEITAYLFLDKGRYYIVTGITAGSATATDFASTLKSVVEGFEITAQ